MQEYTRACTPRNRCRKWKTCHYCGAIRQARFADRAEAAARQMVLPCFYVLLPNDTSTKGIEYARRFFQRNALPKAGVWSIEDSKFQAGYHLNVIADYAELPRSFKGRIYCEQIKTTVRAVAAYMTKKERSVTREQGFARATGDFGHVGDFLLATQRIAPIVAGAQLQYEIDPFYKPAPPVAGESPRDTAMRELRALFEKTTKKTNV